MHLARVHDDRFPFPGSGALAKNGTGGSMQVMARETRNGWEFGGARVGEEKSGRTRAFRRGKRLLRGSKPKDKATVRYDCRLEGAASFSSPCALCLVRRLCPLRVDHSMRDSAERDELAWFCGPVRPDAGRVRDGFRMCTSLGICAQSGAELHREGQGVNASEKRVMGRR
ncbi:hypothetical protein EJ04DRAFT_305116 [Polyplosphaeria fusca]|uniref:Uncharacterized protein n=1 Tax=Polyplosphaeria fusca TaxID=682080 RepID=A0A9P4QUF1_9PLEO|nr:hypothetical protein EJ04DRAFT_305116 [Polyplosphaeria fusca]